MVQTRPGSKRVIGVALLTTCAVMVLLGVLFLAGVFDAPRDRRTIVGIALLSAGAFDLFIGLRFLQRAD